MTTEAPAATENTEESAEAPAAAENTEEQTEVETETEPAPAAEPTGEVTEEEAPAEEVIPEETEVTEEPEEEPAPEQPAEEVTEETVEEESAEPEEEAAPVERKVIVHSTLDGVEDVYEGTKVTLTGELIGYEGLDYRLQWYFRKDGIGDYILIEGADQLTFTYRIDQDNYRNSYHLGVFLMDFTMSGN